jgi:RNA polymerase subunit RPABC4/transcription elongation factor Spt4
MRNTLALVAAGATAGASLAVLRFFASKDGRAGFSSWEIQVLPWILAASVWFAIKNSGQKKPGQNDPLKNVFTEASPQQSIETAAPHNSVNIDNAEAPDGVLVRETTPQKMDSCTNCGKLLRPNAHFYTYCGKGVHIEHLCTNCKAVLRPDANFCVRCGRSIKEQQLSPNLGIFPAEIGELHTTARATNARGQAPTSGRSA